MVCGYVCLVWDVMWDVCGVGCVRFGGVSVWYECSVQCVGVGCGCECVV